ncbi:YdcF family protein [Methylobacterium trifolii]|uniref:DUF218 domain-containing protein n=1 Tax=Methylobacterium trifolii TaxID=1003092 RepID=A0ABQ4TXP0_9HYPH|nr:YdcF family protein [Methylobacterium trifolii]GJE59831.1 hypothetical protein MPOCJGCO_1933 [Methylobacterium trifolii]
MFFPLSKVLFYAITPSNFCILAVLAGFVLAFATRWRRSGAWCVGIGAAGLVAGGLLPGAVLGLMPLEQRFPSFSDDGGPVTGIVVLGGGVDADASMDRNQVIFNDAGERPVYLADLARRYPAARLVFSGGSGSLREDTLGEADVVGRFADTLGLPRSRLILENRSRNTEENARFSAAMVQPKPGERWLLVTSAWHMPRAMGCFRRAGFSVTAFPVDYRTRGWGDLRRPNTFASDGLLQLDLAAKEWLGLLVYRLAGYTDDWLPAPDSPSSAGGSASR